MDENLKIMPQVCFELSINTVVRPFGAHDNAVLNIFASDKKFYLWNSLYGGQLVKQPYGQWTRFQLIWVWTHVWDLSD